MATKRIDNEELLDKLLKNIMGAYAISVQSGNSDLRLKSLLEGMPHLQKIRAKVLRRMRRDMHSVLYLLRNR